MAKSPASDNLHEQTTLSTLDQKANRQIDEILSGTMDHGATDTESLHLVTIVEENIDPTETYFVVETESGSIDDEGYDEEFECAECRGKYNQIFDFIAHKKSNEGCKTMVCEICQRSFNRKDSVIQHYTTHSEQKPFRCEQCNRCFKRKSTLDIHLRVHTNFRPHGCEICGKTFHLKAGLTGHLRCHLSEKTFKCPICPRKYAHKNGISRHLKVHRGERNYACEECGRRFMDKDGLIRHRQTHLDASFRKYPCPQCSKGFGIKHDLKLHLFTHSGEKPLSCDVCGARFIKPNVLRKHKEIHRKRNPLPCGYCNLIFVSVEDLRIHRKQGCEGGAPELNSNYSILPEYQDENEDDGSLVMKIEESGTHSETSQQSSDFQYNSDNILTDALNQLMTIIKEDACGNLESIRNLTFGAKEGDLSEKIISNNVISVQQIEIEQENMTESATDPLHPDIPKSKSVRIKLPPSKKKKAKPRKFIIIKEIMD